MTQACQLSGDHRRIERPGTLAAGLAERGPPGLVAGQSLDRRGDVVRVIRIGIDSNGSEPMITAGTGYSDRDLSAVSDEDFAHDSRS